MWASRVVLTMSIIRGIESLSECVIAGSLGGWEQSYLEVSDFIVVFNKLPI